MFKHRRTFGFGALTKRRAEMRQKPRIQWKCEPMRAVRHTFDAENRYVPGFVELGVQTRRDAKCDQQRGNIFQQRAIHRFERQAPRLVHMTVRIEITGDERQALRFRQ